MGLKLIAGLGNPGPEYHETRHNLGFMVVDELARRHKADLKPSKKWRSEWARIKDITGDVMLAKPHTFMNDSGTALRDLCSFYGVMTSTDLLVIVDDADLPLGKLRLKARGSAGGHNGLKSIISQFGTDAFPRLRIGVGRQAGDLRSHVLGRFSPEEQHKIKVCVKRAADAAELFAKENILAAMNRFNAAQVDEDQA